MSRDFNGTNQKLEYSGTISNTLPVTLACWFQSDSITANQALISLNDGDAPASKDALILAAMGGVGGDPIQAISYDAGADEVASSSAGFTASGWYHACAVFASTTSRSAYLNGANKGTDTNSSSPTNPNAQTELGTDTHLGYWLNGRLAEIAIWDAALTDVEVAALGQGVCPLLIRPESLLAYWPVFGNDSPELDQWQRTFPATVTGATKFADHPRVYQRL